MKTQVILAKEEIEFDKFIKPKGTRKSCNKPKSGGLWTSSLTEDGKSGWIHFVESEDFYEDMSKLKMYHVEVSNNARVLRIESKRDFQAALDKYGVNSLSKEEQFIFGFHSRKILDYTKLSKDFDALSVSKKGIAENYMELFSWDCESTVWFNLEHLTFKLIS